MSAADTAVQVFRDLEPEDFKLLLAIDRALSSFRYAPEKAISKLSRISIKEALYRLSRLEKFGLIRRWTGAYTGYRLNTAGYDSLAINFFVKAGVFEAFGKPLGVGKEADVYDALTADGKRLAVKFHRLGRTSFRQTRRVRGYVAESPRVSWLHQSRLAAAKEFEALKLLYPRGISVPEPVKHNRHVIVMGMIEGSELFQYVEMPNPKRVLDEILFNVQKAYLEVEVVHGDLSEFNIILKPDRHVLIIDWPQFVTKDHPNAETLLRRDVKNVVRFFRRKHGVDTEVKDFLPYIKRNTTS